MCGLWDNYGAADKSGSQEHACKAEGVRISAPEPKSQDRGTGPRPRESLLRSAAELEVTNSPPNLQLTLADPLFTLPATLRTRDSSKINVLPVPKGSARDRVPEGPPFPSRYLGSWKCERAEYFYKTNPQEYSFSFIQTLNSFSYLCGDTRVP